MNLELLVKDLRGAGRGPDSALQGPLGLREAGRPGGTPREPAAPLPGSRRSSLRSSRTQQGQSASHTGRTGVAVTSLRTDRAVRGARGWRSQNATGSLHSGAGTRGAQRPRTRTRQWWRRRPLAGAAVTSRPAELHGSPSVSGQVTNAPSRRWRLSLPAGTDTAGALS